MKKKTSDSKIEDKDKNIQLRVTEYEEWVRRTVTTNWKHNTHMYPMWAWPTFSKYYLIFFCFFFYVSNWNFLFMSPSKIEKHFLYICKCVFGLFFVLFFKKKIISSKCKHHILNSKTGYSFSISFSCFPQLMSIARLVKEVKDPISFSWKKSKTLVTTQNKTYCTWKQCLQTKYFVNVAQCQILTKSSGW